jgi:hypothetical protein
MGSGAVSQSALYRLMNTAAGQQESADSALALTPYEYGNVPIMPSTTNPTTQDRHPSAQRLAAGGQWAGKTSQFNHAQAAQDRANVWVTVPVDEVVTRGGASSVQPVYATPTGYAPRPGESRGSIPPTIPAGRPY